MKRGSQPPSRLAARGPVDVVKARPARFSTVEQVCFDLGLPTSRDVLRAVEGELSAAVVEGTIRQMRSPLTGLVFYPAVRS